MGAHRKETGQHSSHLAVEFHWHITRTCNPQGACLEIFHIGQLGMGAEGYGLKIAHDIPVALVLKDQHIEQSIEKACSLENRKRTAVKPAISDECEGTLADPPAFGFQHHTGWLVRGDLNEREKITERSERPFGIGCGFADDLGVQPHPGELNEMRVVGFGEVDFHNIALLDDTPSALEVSLGNAQLRGKNIHCADWKDSQTHWSTADAVDDFIERAIPSRCDDDLKSFPNGLRCDVAGITGFRGKAHGRTARERGDSLTETTGFVAAGGGIQNDERLIHTSLSKEER